MKNKYKWAIESFVTKVGVDNILRLGSFDKALNFVYDNIKNNADVKCDNLNSLKNSVYYYLKNYLSFQGKTNVFKMFNYRSRLDSLNAVYQCFENDADFYRELFSGVLASSSGKRNPIVVVDDNPRLTTVLNMIKTNNFSFIVDAKREFYYVSPTEWTISLWNNFSAFYDHVENVAVFLCKNEENFNDFLKIIDMYRKNIMVSKYNVSFIVPFFNFVNKSLIKKYKIDNLPIPVGNITFLSYVLFTICYIMKKNKLVDHFAISDVSDYYSVLIGVDLSIFFKYRSIIYDFLKTEYHCEIIGYIVNYMRFLDSALNLLYNSERFVENMFGLLLLLIRYRNIMNSNVKWYYQSVVTQSAKNISVCGL